MSDMANDDQDDAARAFRELTAEVTVMRRAVEAMATKEPIDYSPTLGAVTKGLDKLAAATNILSERPAMKITTETYAAQLRRATEDAARPMSAELQRAQGLTGQMERALGGIRTRQEQRVAVLQVGAVVLAFGLVVGFFLLTLFVRALPESWNAPERVAAYIVGDDRWTAGQAMMSSANPDAWARIAQMAEPEGDSLSNK